MNVKYEREGFFYLFFLLHSKTVHLQLLKAEKVRCGLKYMLSPEKLAEMSAQIASDLFQFMQVSHFLICLLLTSPAASELPV